MDALREQLFKMIPEEICRLHEGTLDILKSNRVFRKGIIGDMWWGDFGFCGKNSHINFLVVRYHKSWEEKESKKPFFINIQN